MGTEAEFLRYHSVAKSYGGSGIDESTCVQQTIDGGFIIAGGTTSVDGDITTNHGAYDYWILKLSSTGTIQWQKTFGGSGNDNAYYIRQTFDSGYIVAGQSSSDDGEVTGHHGGAGSSDFWIVKLSVSGNMQWEKSFGGSMNDDPAFIEQTSDSGFIIAGDTYSTDGDVTGNHGGEDYWVVKLSSNGSLQWEKTLGGSGSDYAQSVRQTTDGGYILSGGSNSTDMDITGNIGHGDFWIVKLSSSGTIQWQKSLGGTSDDVGTCISLTYEGGYIVTGWVSSNDIDVTGFHGTTDYWVVKLTSSGAIEWQKDMGSLGLEAAWDVEPTRDSGYIIAGYTFFIGGDVTFNHGDNDVWIVKLKPPSIESVVPVVYTPISITPNPATDNIFVSGSNVARVYIFNVLGQLVKVAGYSDTVSISDLSNGMYLIKLSDENGLVIKVEKIIKE